jgi:hypothetical protein
MQPALLLALTPLASAGELEAPTPTALVQTWLTAFDQDTDPQADPASYGDPEQDIGFSITRARAGLRGEADRVLYEVSVGVGSPFDRLSSEELSVGIIDAFVGVALGDLTISGGTQRVPFSRDTLISSTDLVFQERSVGHSWIAPGREVGAVADFRHSSGFRARLGGFNGGGTLFGNDDNALLGALRLEFAKGDIYRSWDPSGETAFGVGLASFYAGGLTSRRLAAGGDVLFRVAHFNVMGEVSWLSIQPGDANVIQPDVLETTGQLGWSAQISYFIPVGDGDGGLEPAVRAASFDDAMGISDNGDVLILHAGASWRDVTPGVDVGLGFIHREEMGGRALANDTARLWLQFRYPGRDVRIGESSTANL